MFKLISLALHFSPFRGGPIDPHMVEMLRREQKKPTAEKQSAANISQLGADGSSNPEDSQLEKEAA